MRLAAFTGTRDSLAVLRAIFSDASFQKAQPACLGDFVGSGPDSPACLLLTLRKGLCTLAGSEDLDICAKAGSEDLDICAKAASSPQAHGFAPRSPGRVLGLPRQFHLEDGICLSARRPGPTVPLLHLKELLRHNPDRSLYVTPHPEGRSGIFDDYGLPWSPAPSKTGAEYFRLGEGTPCLIYVSQAVSSRSPACRIRYALLDTETRTLAFRSLNPSAKTRP